ncbi:MAG: DUF2127 domain-containing protein [Luteimonas sp.]
MPAAGDHYDPDPHHHPGLHAIAIVEAVKGTLAVLAASGLEVLGPRPLQQFVHELIARFQFDPHHGALALLAQKINPDSVHITAAVFLAYGVVHLIEAWGLWRFKAWASWLGCLAAAIYLPFDLYALIRYPGWLAILVVAINVLVVWVLARDIVRRRR